MASVSVTRLYSWGNLFSRCQAPLDSLRTTRRSAAAFIGMLVLGVAILYVPTFSFAALFNGARIVASQTATVRSVAGTSASVVGTQKANALGSIIGGPVSADSSTWWKVNFEAGPDGWVVASQLALPYFPPSESAGGWRRIVGINTTPSASQKTTIQSRTGIDWDKLALANDYSKSYASSATLLVIRNGWVAGEWGTTSASAVASVTKSFTGLATAKMYEMSNAGSFSKTISSNSFLYNYLPATWDDDDARKRDIRIRHLTTMTSGLEPDDNPGQADYLNVVLTQPMEVAPATEWSYASLPLELLSIAIQNVTDMTLRDFFNQKIGSRIGVPPLSWATVGPYTRGSSGVSIRPRDLARVGYLMMMNGAWSGGSRGQQQIVGKTQITTIRMHPSFLDSVTFAATPGSPFKIRTDSPEFYAHLWWTNITQAALGTKVPKSAYYAHGFGEDLLVVVPSHNMVVVRMGNAPDSLETFKRELMSDVMDSVVTQ